MIFNAKKPVKSFKVMHFGITDKPTMDCVSLYNNASLISKVPGETASENAENCRCRQSYCRLTPPPQKTLANIRINLISSESTVIGLNFLLLIVWLYLHSNFCGRIRKTHHLCNKVRIGRRPLSRIFWRCSAG